MFNGLIRSFGQIKSYQNESLEISSNLCEQINAKLGDSIAINGVCLSITKISRGGFSVQISSESQAVIAPFIKGDLVHLEPAMALNERIDGHLLQGHIDSLGRCEDIKKLQCGTDLFIKVLNPKACKYIANKGSIGINGVSLTVNHIHNDIIRLTLIPITLEKTLFARLNIGDLINIETDLLARYAERILSFKEHSGVLHAALY